MVKEFTYEQALKVAQADYDNGVIWTIDELMFMGFDCSSYYKNMDKKEMEENYDYYNLLYRDNLYKELGIYETMQKAYEEVWK